MVPDAHLAVKDTHGHQRRLLGDAQVAAQRYAAHHRAVAVAVARVRCAVHDVGAADSDRVMIGNYAVSLLTL